MKELEKTKRISIASVITILVVLIAVLSYKRPKHNYEINSAQTLEQLTKGNFIITQELLNENNHLLIDIRNQFEFDKGHLPNAVNIATAEILSDDNTALLKSLKQQNKTMVLYGTTPDESLVAYMILSQLEYPDLKIAAINIYYEKNQLKMSPFIPEEKGIDIQQFINKKKKEAAIKALPPPKPIAKRKILPKKKKKKMPVEGGC